MTNLNVARWLLVVLAIAGLAVATPVVSAHATESPTNETADNAPPYNGSAVEWTAWMEAHMTEHMGPGAVEQMESHMGMTVDEMGQQMAAGNHPRDQMAAENHPRDQMAAENHPRGGMGGPGYGC